jgi:hypothetical protein
LRNLAKKKQPKGGEHAGEKGRGERGGGAKSQEVINSSVALQQVRGSIRHMRTVLSLAAPRCCRSRRIITRQMYSGTEKI